MKDWHGSSEARFDHLCPIGRADPETRHTHPAMGETNFYHDDPKDSEWGYITIMFIREKFGDGRTLTYPTAVNVTAMGTSAAWREKISDHTRDNMDQLGDRIAALLHQSRMVTRET